MTATHFVLNTEVLQLPPILLKNKKSFVPHCIMPDFRKVWGRKTTNQQLQKSRGVKKQLDNNLQTGLKTCFVRVFCSSSRA